MVFIIFGIQLNTTELNKRAASSKWEEEQQVETDKSWLYKDRNEGRQL